MKKYCKTEQKAKRFHNVTILVSAIAKRSSFRVHILVFTTDVYKSGYGTLTSVDRFQRQASPSSHVVLLINTKKTNNNARETRLLVIQSAALLALAILLTQSVE